MAYKNFSLYFKLIDQIVYEIIANLFNHSYFLILIPLILFSQIIKRTAYTKIQIPLTFFLLILKTCLLKKNCLYI